MAADDMHQSFVCKTLNTSVALSVMTRAIILAQLSVSLWSDWLKKSSQLDALKVWCRLTADPLQLALTDCEVMPKTDG